MSNATAEILNQDNELSCVIIPCGESDLLLPNVSVAEIVPWRRIKATSDGPQWCMGYTGWRGLTIPVLNFAGFAGLAAPDNLRCLVVMNRARTRHGAAFYALAASALPYMVQLGDEDLKGENDSLGPADVMVVRMGTFKARIPDLEYIETQVAGL